MSQSARIVTAHWGDPGVITVDGYLAGGGYEGLRRALGMTPAEVIDELKASGLRGRGGAGFPTGVKWSFVPQNTGKPTYVVCNFDESEPGTYNNRELIEREPHQLLEGLAIAAYAVQSHTAFIYCRGEFLWPGTVLQRAIAEAYGKGFLGPDVLGSGYNLEVVLHRGAGAYICGEETALLSSLEGFRGQPRLRPPFPAVEGLYESPTLINNVETLCFVPHILRRGAAWFAAIGPEKSPGTKIFSISGKVERPGNYELPMGTPFRVLLEEHAGGVLGGRALKAWTPGGSSTPLLTAEHRDVELDFEAVQAAGSLLGTGAVMVMDETDCIVEATRRMLQFYAHESCGKCTPCREGTWWVSRVLARIENGYGRPQDLELLLDTADNMLFKAFCALADAAASPIQSSLRYFREEYERHVAEHRCPFTGIGPGAVEPERGPDETGSSGPEPSEPALVDLGEVLR
ncbi:MAG TPA: NADH-quinone oxidoreductase subunit NuoF [Actinomycetota bacterium]|nr:NADH-quinone oxidoreductase subunit NuoF [Actinomycetota bacterium]